MCCRQLQLMCPLLLTAMLPFRLGLDVATIALAHVCFEKLIYLHSVTKVGSHGEGARWAAVHVELCVVLDRATVAC